MLHMHDSGEMLLQGIFCIVSAGQPSCVLYTTVISNIFVENARRCVVLIGGVEVKFKYVLDGVCSGMKRFLLHQERPTLTYGQRNG